MSDIINIEVQEEEVPVIHITVDENAAQTALDAAAAAQTALDEITILISTGTTRTPYSTFKFIQKGFENTNLLANEIGDVFCGWKNDGTERYPEAKWLGGGFNGFR